MAKRFTDTEKWKRPWFRSLTMKQKLIWLYLCDDCDHAGIWLGDFELMTFQLGFKVSESDLLDLFGDKISKYGDKFLLNNFYDFQYSQNKDTFKAKQSALEKITYLKKLKTDTRGTLPRESIDCPSISIGIIKSKSITEGGLGETKLLEIYNFYPKKVGKKSGLAKLRTILKNDQDFDRLKTAIERYKTKLSKDGTESKYIKQFDTFLSSWEDWLDPEAGTSEKFTAGGMSREDWNEIWKERDDTSGI